MKLNLKIKYQFDHSMQKENEQGQTNVDFNNFRMKSYLQ